MTIRHVVWRTIRHYRRSFFAVVAGLAVTTAVITGSLVIGSSLRGSLFDLSLRRLGGVHFAALLPRPMSEQITTGTAALPMLRTTGTATPAMGEPRPEPVTVWGVDAKSAALLHLPSVGDGVLINAALARDLQANVGDEISLSGNRPRAIGTDSLFARRKLADVMATVQLPVTAILPDHGPGDFRLDGQSARPRNVFISREALARVLDLEGKANVLIAAAGPSVQDLNAAVAHRLTLVDHGLHLRLKSDRLSLTSEAFTLTQSQVQAAQQVAQRLGAKTDPVSVYLATTIRAPNGREIAYAIVAGNADARRLGLPEPWAAPDARVVLNTWAAQDLQAKPRDVLTLQYLVPQPDGSFATREQRALLVGCTAIQGPTADAHLMPEYEGLTDAVTLGDWKPPFPLDMSRLTPRDEEYWERYKTVPKAFLPLGALRVMWGSSAAYVTSLEIIPPVGQTPAALASAFRTAVLTQLNVADETPIVFRDMRQAARAASTGTTDFSQLFLALSLFIIAAGVGIAAMLVRLGVERRTDQIGLLLAIGMDERLIRRLLLSEGTVLNLGGVLLGLPLGALYAAALVGAMSAYWRSALGDAPALWLHVRLANLLLGAVSGLLIGHVSIRLSLRSLRQLQPIHLWQYGLHRAADPPARHNAARLFVMLALLLILAAGLLAGAWGRGAVLQALGFFAAGALLLGAAFPALSLSLSGGHRRTIRRWPALAWRHASLHLRRSQLVFGLLAAASFVLVATAASTRNWGLADAYDRNSGTGGYNLIGTSTVPLPYDPGTPEGRRNLGFMAADEAVLSRCEFVSILAGPGDDLSCMSASNPGAPRLLARPEKLQLKTDYGDRQSRRQTASADGAIPAVGDADTVLWRLHLKIGSVWDTQDAFGRPLKLRIEGLLHRSVLAGYLLIAEHDFRRLYPDVTAPSVFLIRTPPQDEASAMAALRGTLGDLGLQIRPTREVLTEYAQAQNVYISMFLSLGALGLLLGTVGLAVVTVRNIVERRRELALLAAMGFSQRRLVALLLLEHGGLAALGLLAGALAALVAMMPQLWAPDSSVNWPSLAAALAAVLLVGVGVNIVAIGRSLERDLIGGLRHE